MGEMNWVQAIDDVVSYLYQVNLVGKRADICVAELRSVLASADSHPLVTPLVSELAWMANHFLAEDDMASALRTAVLVGRELKRNMRAVMLQPGNSGLPT